MCLSVRLRRTSYEQIPHQLPVPRYGAVRMGNFDIPGDRSRAALGPLRVYVKHFQLRVLSHDEQRRSLVQHNFDVLWIFIPLCFYAL